MRSKLLTLEGHCLSIGRTGTQCTFNSYLSEKLKCSFVSSNLSIFKIVSVGSHLRSFSQGSSMRAERRQYQSLKGTPARRALACISAAFSLLLAGCGGNATAVSSGVQNSTMALPKVAQVTNFGASITCGYYATQQSPSGNVYSQLGYAGRFDASLGVPAQNLCRAGDQAADMVHDWVQPNARPALRASQLYTVMVGTNDAQDCGASAPCIANWRNSLTAALTWLALPATDKILGSSLQDLSTAWQPDLQFGVATNVANASLSFPVTQTVAGRTLYIAYRIWDANTVTGGHAIVKLDGVSVATLHSIVNTGHSIHTHNGLTDTIVVAAIPLGDAGKHTVTLTTGSSGGLFSFQWAGVSSGTYASVPGAPRVLSAMLPTTANATLNVQLETYNSALVDVVGSLVADGMHITLVPCGSTLNADTDLYDTVHPNDTGHQKLTTVFKSVL